MKTTNLYFAAAVLALALAPAAFGRQITPQEALARLQASPQQSGMLRAPGAQAQLALTVATPADGEQAALYLFAQPQASQILVLAADDQAPALLGYVNGTTVTSLDELPLPMQTWLQGYAEQIQWLREHPEAAEPTLAPGRTIYANLCAGGGKPEWTPVAPLCSTKWNQDAPFNDLCPKKGTTQTATGCMATAMAQLMKRYNYPATGTGSITYSDSGTSRSMNFASTTFDWDNMLDVYTSGSYTDAQGEAVALLMKACGYASKMSYGASSGTSDISALTGIKKYLRYNEGAELLLRDYFPLAEWEELIYQNLQAGQPLLYSGFTPNMEGHAFVCDGYSSDGYYHFNWGWGGEFDGYFRLIALNPEGFGIGGAAGGFNFRQSIMSNLVPDNVTPGAPKSKFTGIVTDGNLKVSGSKASCTISVDDGYLLINRGTDGAFDFGIALEDAETGNITYKAKYTAQTLNSNYYVSSMQVALPSGLSGTYYLYPVYRPAGTDTWIRPMTKIGCVNHGVVDAFGSIYSITSVNAVNPVVTDLSWQTPQYYGVNVKLHAKVSYPAEGSEWYGGIGVALFNASTYTQVGAGTGAAVVDIEAGETQEIDLITTLDRIQNGAALADGTYLMIFYNIMTGDILSDPFTVELTKGSPGKLKNLSLVVAPGQDSNSMDYNDMRFATKVQCTTGFYSNPLTIIVQKVLSYYNKPTVMQFDTECIFLQPDDVFDTEFTVSLSNPDVTKDYNIGTYYLFAGYLYELKTIKVKLAPTSGIEDVAAAKDEALKIGYEAATGRVNAAGAVTLEAFTPAGVKVASASRAAADGAAMELSLDEAPAGVIIIIARDAEGNAQISKIVR